MLKYVLLAIVIASPAWGYSFKLSHSATEEAGANQWETAHFENGRVTVYLDVDGNTNACGADLFAVFPSSQLNFEDSQRLGSHPEAPAGCRVESNDGVHEGCHDCDSVLHCRVENLFSGNAEIMPEPEVAAQFSLAETYDPNMVIGVFNDWFIIHARDAATGRCDDEVVVGAAEWPSGILVPEPGLMLGLLAGIPTLVWMRRRNMVENYQRGARTG